MAPPHGKSLWRQIGASPLVSSQERRAAVILVISRLSPGRWFKKSFVCSCFQRIVQNRMLSRLWRNSPGRTDPSASRPAWLRSAPPPRRAPLRPDPPVVCPGLVFDRYIGFRVFVLPKNRSGQFIFDAMEDLPWANQAVGFPSCPAALRPAAPQCATPPGPTRCMSGFRFRPVHRISFVCSCFRKIVQDSCLRCFGSPARQRERLPPGRIDPSASCPARRFSAPPSCLWYIRVSNPTNPKDIREWQSREHPKDILEFAERKYSRTCLA